MTINTKCYYIYTKVDWTNLIMQHLINLAMLQDLKPLLGLCMFVFTTANATAWTSHVLYLKPSDTWGIIQ